METHSNIALVHVDGDLDVTSVPRVKRRLEGLIDGGCRRIVLNMAQTDYVDSAGMGLLLGEVRRMRRVGGLLSITEASDMVLRALRMARLVDFIPVSGARSGRKIQDLDPSAVARWSCCVRVDPQDLAGTRIRVGQLLGRTGLVSDDLFDLTLAVGEAMGNAVDHTSGECVLVTISAYEDRVLVDVTDCGDGFQIADDEDTPQVDGSAERGRGIKLMRLLADSVSICRKPTGTGTLVRIVKLV